MLTRFLKAPLFLVFGLSLLGLSVEAKELPVVLKLVSIQAERTSEKSGDDLYFSITSYSNKKRAGLNRVPMEPLHWLSNNLEAAKDKLLWQDSLQEGEEIEVLISFMRQENPPWDPDNLLGCVEVQLKNHKGRLVKRWGPTKLKDAPPIEMKPKHHLHEQAFKMEGAGAIYEVNFSVH